MNVFAVHATKPNDIGAVEVVFGSEKEAHAFAVVRSRDPEVLAASVTRYLIDQLGARYPVAWYVDGNEQPQRAVRPGRMYPVPEMSE